jgi:hypothetical protein
MPRAAVPCTRPIDLSRKNAVAFRKSLDRFVNAARRGAARRDVEPFAASQGGTIDERLEGEAGLRDRAAA